jgi:hypothetical protein
MGPFKKNNEQGIVLTPIKILITRIIPPFFELRNPVDVILSVQGSPAIHFPLELRNHFDISLN